MGNAGRTVVGAMGGAAAWHVRPKSLQCLAEVGGQASGPAERYDADREGSGNLVVLALGQV